MQAVLFTCFDLMTCCSQRHGVTKSYASLYALGLQLLQTAYWWQKLCFAAAQLLMLLHLETEHFMSAYRAHVMRCCLPVCINGLANSRYLYLATLLQVRLPKQGRTDAGSIREVYNLYTDNTLSVTSITTVKGQTEKCIQVGMVIIVTDTADMRRPCTVVIFHQHMLWQQCHH